MPALGRIRVLVLAALAALVVVLVLLLSAGKSGSTAAGPEPFFQADPQLLADPQGTVETLRKLGVARIRLSLPWTAIAPSPGSLRAPQGFNGADPGAYPANAWAPYDAVIRDASARGIAIDLTVAGGAPLWATGTDAPAGVRRNQWKPSAQAFGSFVRAVAKRYSGRFIAPGAQAPLPKIDFWAIWNEPNYGPDLAPQAIHQSTVEVAPALYRALLDAAWGALQSTGHRHDTILIGELAPRGLTFGDNPGNFQGMVPLRFLRALYCVDSSYQPLRGLAATIRGCPARPDASSFRRAHPSLFEASGFADHPYPQGQPPNVAAPDEPDYADLPAIPRLESALDRTQRAYGSSRRLPIYSTEFGYQTNPPERDATRVTPATAARYLNWAEYITWRDPRLRSYMQYLLIDPPRGNFATGLVFANGRPKPTYAAYRLPLFLPRTAGLRGQAFEVWGCARPARYVRSDTRKHQHAEIQFKPSGGTTFRTVQTVEITSVYGYFDVHYAFASSGEVRLAWTFPNGHQVYSRVQTISLR